MSDERSCDVCGLSETTLLLEQISYTLPLQDNEDELWLCKTCQERLTIKSTTQELTHDLDEKLALLVGESAGAICRTLELQYVPPYKSVIDAASKIGYDQDLFMSAWLFISQWQDGTTLWREANGHATAQVTPDGKVNIQEI